MLDFLQRKQKELPKNSLDLRDKDLRGMNFSGLCLDSFSFRRAKLQKTNFNGARLRNADFRDANLRNADLRNIRLDNNSYENTRWEGANLRGALLPDFQLPEGDLTGWKICHQGILVQLLIPKETPRTATLVNSGCRAERAFVVRVYNDTGIAFSYWYKKREALFAYQEGKTVVTHFYDDDIRTDYAGGIHFYRTREKALKMKGWFQ